MSLRFLRLIRKFGATLLCVSVLSFGGGVGCTSSNDNDTNEKIIILAALFTVWWPQYTGPGPIGTYLQRANIGQEAWQIGLVPNQTAYQRSLGGTTHADWPAHWITVTGDTCVARGVPADMQGDGCSLGGAVIGVCRVRYLTSGEVGRIIDTTMLQLDTFQSGASSEAEKQSVFTHEIGHCLGLKHSASLLDIMYSDTTGADTPSSGELAAVASAYKPTVQSPTTGATRFNTTSGQVVRHWTFPDFTISHNIGNAFTNADAPEEPPLGEPILDSTAILTHYFYEGGHVESVLQEHP